tara:strand:+ start:94 stop:492 length:399 start_codon:yes stop_codon:yes gene_type:complete
MQKVYLAGGHRSDWQFQVKNNVKALTYFDPKLKEEILFSQGTSMTLEEYGTWDLHHIKQSDIVFVYAETDNPSCIGLAVEMGYAKGLGKTVILVLEPGHSTILDRYLKFLTKAADVTFDNLEDGINYLKYFK